MQLLALLGHLLVFHSLYPTLPLPYPARAGIESVGQFSGPKVS